MNDKLLTLYYTVIRKIKDVYYEIFYFVQRCCKGYDDRDVFDLYGRLAKRMLPILKEFKETSHGFPVDFSPECGYKGTEEEGIAEWEAILDEIIWTMNEIAYQTEEEAVFERDPYEVTFTSNGIKVSDEEKANKHYEETKKISERVQKGCELFGRYLSALWN